MKRIKRFIRRTIFFALVLAIVLVVLNSRTRFFKDIGKNIPFLDNFAPGLSDSVSYYSDKVNEYVALIPSPQELWASITKTELPIDPEDVAANAYLRSDTMLNFYNGENISVAPGRNTLDVYGVTHRSDERYLVYRIVDKDMNTLSETRTQCDFSGQYRAVIDIPAGADQLVVYTGAESSGEYASKLYNYIYLERGSDGVWGLRVPPVYEHNVKEFEKARSMSASLKSTYDICSDYPDIKALAESLTKVAATDYDKALKIHDWVCENIYYDEDGVSSTNISSTAYVASDVLYQRKAVCLGYSNLFAALCRAAGIGCNVVTGYALGVEEGDIAWTETSINTSDANHAWNEVYLDGRWVLVDTTWDSQNKLTGGSFVPGRSVSHLFFDANLRFFSQNHKIIGYSK